MSVLIKDYRAVVAIFFWLSIPEPTLRKVFLDAGFREVVAPLPPIPVIPGIQVTVTPPRKAIASYKSVKVSWDESKFMLSLEGVIDDLVEVLKAVKESFNMNGYPLEKVCHYYEVTFVTQPVDIDGFVVNLRKKFSVEIVVGDEKLKPFSISFSNATEPITKENFYRWMHISINPDVNAPQKRVFLQVIKRDVDFNRVVRFLEDIRSLIEQLKKFFMSG